MESFFFTNLAWPGHVTPKIFRVPPNISETGKAMNVKFGRPIQKNSLNILWTVQEYSVPYYLPISDNSKVKSVT